MSTPWNRKRSKLPAHIPTMISSEEQRYLYWLTRTHWQDVGHVVEMGPWLGGSSYCLLEGMQGGNSHGLHVFDNFVWREFMGGRGGPELADGESFESHFRMNLAPHADRLTVHNAWLPDEEAHDDPELAAIREPIPADAKMVAWQADEPVEILFVDGAKSWRGLTTLLATFVDALIPDRSLLVFQDYKYWGEYWVAAITEMLSDTLTFEHQTRENTVTFRVREGFDRARIESLRSSEECAADELGQLLESAGRRIGGHGSATDQMIVELTKVRMLIHKNDRQRAVETFRDIESRWPLLGNGYNLEAARRWLQRTSGAALVPAVRSKTRAATDRILKPLRR